MLLVCEFQILHLEIINKLFYTTPRCDTFNIWPNDSVVSLWPNYIVRSILWSRPSLDLLKSGSEMLFSRRVSFFDTKRDLIFDSPSMESNGVPVWDLLISKSNCYILVFKIYFTIESSLHDVILFTLYVYFGTYVTKHAPLVSYLPLMMKVVDFFFRHTRNLPTLTHQMDCSWWTELSSRCP